MRYRSNSRKREIDKNGFTLIEALIGVAVFLVISTASYQAYASLFTFISLNQYKVIALNLANEQIEIARNLPYGDLEEMPHSQSLVRSGISFNATNTVVAEDERKLVEVEVGCPTCKDFSPLVLTSYFYE